MGVTILHVPYNGSIHLALTFKLYPRASGIVQTAGNFLSLPTAERGEGKRRRKEKVKDVFLVYYMS